jgi:hypothetical protein
MFKNKSFYKILVAIYMILVLPNMLFQMRGEKRMFQEDPLLFFGVTFIGAILCALVMYKLFVKKK